MPGIDWESNDQTGQPAMLKNLMDEMFVSNHMKDCTRDDNVLDLVLTNNEFSISHN